MLSVLSTPRRSVVPYSSRPPATAASARACTARPRSRSLTLAYTPSATVAPVTHSLVYSYDHRRKKKGDFRRLWIQRINAASRAQGLTYNRLIQGLNLAGVEVDRRMLAELAVNDINAFNALVKVAKDALPADINAPKA